MSAGVSYSLPAPGVALIRIERPERLNAIDPDMDAAMRPLWIRADEDDAVRCVILTGAGDRAFCAGADIERLLPWLRERVEAGLDDGSFCGVTPTAPTRKPVIAAINGLALGGGLELALACDLRIASTSARFGLPEVSVGVLAGGGGVTRLSRFVPVALAAEMLLTGDPIDADAALLHGLVSRVVSPERLMETALGLGTRIARNAPLSVERTLALVHGSRSLLLEDGLAQERQAFRDLVVTADAREGIAAFAEKRPPAFVGR